jgi:hypothetical protein
VSCTRPRAPASAPSAAVVHPIIAAGEWAEANADSAFVEAAGLAIEALREPPIAAERVREEPRDEVHRRVPMFVFMRARRNR